MKRHIFVCHHLSELQSLQNAIIDRGVDTLSMHLLSKKKFTPFKSFEPGSSSNDANIQTTSTTVSNNLFVVVGFLLVLIAYAAGITELTAGWSVFMFCALATLIYFVRVSALLNFSCSQTESISNSDPNHVLMVEVNNEEQERLKEITSGFPAITDSDQ